MIVTKRDEQIILECLKWRGLLARQIKELVPFDGERNLYRRLRILIENGYLERKRYVYGVPSIYTVTAKTCRELDSEYRPNPVKVSLLNHTILVVDTVIFLMKEYHISSGYFISESQLRKDKGFSYKGHMPDFVFKPEERVICVEVELTLKNKKRLEENIKSNLMNYGYQIWVVNGERLFNILKEFSIAIPGLEVIKAHKITEERTD